jgi:signal transduction histidine kinase
MACVKLRRFIALTAGAAMWALSLGATAAVLTHRGDAAGHRAEAAAVNVPFVAVSLLAGAAFAAAGALLLAARPRNALGPVLYVAGASLVVEYALREYAYRGLPQADVAAWAGLTLDGVFFPGSMALVLLLFPDGQPAGRGKRALVAAGAAVVALTTALNGLRAGPLVDEAYGYEIPWRGVLPAGAALDGLNRLGLLLLLAGAVLLVVRYRRSDATGRQQIKPLAFAACVAVLALAVQAIPQLRTAGVVCLVVAVAAGFPAALAVGALRYRLWDLDPIFVATIVYGVLAVLVAGVYIGAVVGFAAFAGSRVSQPALLPSIAATALVAVLFGPVKERVTRAARRLVYGVRASPYEALAALPHQLAETPAVDEVLPRTAGALTLGLGVPRARVRAYLDGTPLQAWSPAPPDDDPDLITVPVRHLGEVVGDVAVLPSADRPLGAADRRLLADLAAQAGPALRGVALAAQLQGNLAELRASRQRIVAAQAEERRRIERDIHDGAQQRLVALAVGIQGAETLLLTDPEAGRAALRRCRDDLGRCIDDLRELARGVYPPVLAARGLAAALRARGRSGGVRVVATPAVDGLRFDPDVELAVYFTCLEALQNAAKHAPGATVTVSLDLVDGELRFAVTDDGAGFDPDTARGRGTGLLSMADRIGAAGGSLTVESAPGRGTAVRGSVG